MSLRVADERRRLAYLQALGVPVWVPRFVLPLARPSARVVLAPPAEAASAPPVPSVAAAVPAVAVAPEPAPAPIPELPVAAPVVAPPQPSPRAELPAVPAAVATEAVPVTQAAREPQAAELNPRFSLAMVRAGSVLVVDALSPDRPHFTSAQQRLLSELLFALGAPASELQPKRFDWPQVDAHHSDKSAAAARVTLASYVDRCLEEGVRTVLALGEQACDTLLAMPWREARGGLHRCGEAQVRVSHSLGAMLDEPSLKAEVWRDLGGRLGG